MDYQAVAEIINRNSGLLSPLTPSRDMHRTLSAISARLSWNGGHTIRAGSTFGGMTAVCGLRLPKKMTATIAKGMSWLASARNTVAVVMAITTR